MKVVVGGGKVVPLPIGFERAGGERPSLRLETPPYIVGRKSFLFRLVVGRPSPFPFRSPKFVLLSRGDGGDVLGISCPAHRHSHSWISKNRD